MRMRSLCVAALTISLAACNTVGRLSVKDHVAKSGERVMAGQAEPKGEYGCQRLSEESQPWGFKGNLNSTAAMQKLTATAVDSAPGKGANYAFVSPPSEATIGGFDVNTFRDAKVVYYKCGSLPAPAP